MPTAAPSDLERFVTAQEAVFDTALAELTVGKKQSHWMWFIFPQLRGLGHSSMAHIYGISSLDEARAYLEHPLLGHRLVRCTETVLESDALSLRQLFGFPDDLKFCSSMTLFAEAASDPYQENLFRQALNSWCKGHRDEKTLDLLSTRGEGVE